MAASISENKQSFRYIL